jgi:hypothetical protein
MVPLIIMAIGRILEVYGYFNRAFWEYSAHVDHADWCTWACAHRAAQIPRDISPTAPSCRHVPPVKFSMGRAALSAVS